MRRAQIGKAIGWLTLAITVAMARPLGAWQEPAERSPSEVMLSDAQLADVAFVDSQRGWAVGDRGVIWHTVDGGRHWNLQRSGVECRLSSVVFLDAQHGWAAGGYSQPYTHATVGVVLHTDDGGATWKVRRDKILPAIQQIGFFDATRGWAVGESSPLFPTGTFTTDDGGRSWHAVPGSLTQNWLTADFLDPNTGAVAGRDGLFATIRRRGIGGEASDFGLRGLHRMKLAAPAGGWLVGDGGLVLQTADLGATWQTTATVLPAGGNTQFDYRALAVRGSRVWIAGVPGTKIFHSPDAGQTWKVAETGQPLPIHSLAFADDEHGWAVGDLGLILSTADGGRTWHKQRSGGERSAIVGFFSRPRDLPAELLAKLSADEGYLAAVEFLNREDAEVRSPRDPSARTHQAAVAAGASAANTSWLFPLRSAELNLSSDQLVEDWNRVNDGQALDKIEAHIVARIRMWRPNLVVTVGADARDALALAVNQVVLRAAERAADPTAFPQQIAEGGLRPWKIQKVYATTGGSSGNATINTAQITTRLGRSIGELSAPARGLVSRQYVTPPASVGFRLLVDQIPQGLGERDFFSGISLSPGSEARRAFFETSQNNLAAAQREAERFRNLQAILDRADKDQADGHFVANLGDQTRDLSPDRAAEVLFQLAKRYAVKGQGELAAECYDVIAERHQEHPLAGAALVWLVQYYASGEAALRNRGANQVSRQHVATQAFAAPQGGRDGIPAGGVGGAVQQLGSVVQAAGVTPSGGKASDREQSMERAERASGYAQQLEQIDPGVAFEPRVRFPLAIAQRRQGLSGPAIRFYQALKQSRPNDVWRACAESELWIIEREGRPTKELWQCALAASKPRLDGRLEEPLWSAGNVVELHSPQRDDADWGAVAIMAYDEEFLYLGLSCSRSARFRYQASQEPRPRDADLSQQDRVELLVDIDHDFATYYRLAVDHRGWTAESCWHDPSWNPGWFVASGGDEHAWTAEIAIPLAELSSRPIDGKSTWAVGVQRVVPGVGFQSWTQPASPEVTAEGFGYLMFQQGVAVPGK